MNIPKITNTLEKFKDTNKIESFDSAIEAHSFWDRHLNLGDIDEEVGAAIEGMIRFWNQYDDENNIPVEERKPIKIYIDSNGGDLGATFTMMDAIRISKTPVWTINIGSAYSGGFFTFITGHKRFAYPHSSFLFHEGSAQTGGTSGQFENFSAFYKKRLTRLKDSLLEYTKVSNELYEEKKREDWWLDANEALELGICDEIIKEFI